MPPKLDIDVKLKQLRSYIAANLSQLASGDRTTLKAIFAARKRESNADANFYKFLWSNERTFTDAQRAHAEETMALVNRHRANSGDAHPAAAVGHENSGVGQPAARGFTLATEAGARGADAESSGISQPAANKGATSNAVASSGVVQAPTEWLPRDAQIAKESDVVQGRLGKDGRQEVGFAKAPTAFSQPEFQHPKKATANKTGKRKAAVAEGSSVLQPVVAKRRQDIEPGKEESVQGSGVSQLAVHEPAKEVKLKAAGKGATNKALDHKVLLLQLKRPHYDAIKSRRKLWEARPLVDSKARGWQPSIFNKLAQVGRTVVLQSGAGTNDRVRVAEVRRYTSGTDAGASAVQDMVVELNADLLPDVVGARERAEVYTDLYGHQRCAGGFVAMRLEWPCEASTAASVGVHQG